LVSCFPWFSSEVTAIWIETIGGVAAFSTTACWIPQAVKILREKRTEGLSVITQFVFTVGVGLWLTYGLLLHDWPLMLANGVTLVLSLAILILKIRYK
jgi:MtN3 and saliva related transmembrane protein